MLKTLFSTADELAELHACLTSARGGNFRLRLLHALEKPLEESELELLRLDAEVNEYRRHLHQLVDLALVETQPANDTRTYLRTPRGEQAVNAVRELERRLGEDDALSLHAANLGPNSIRLFLRVYGDGREPDWKSRQVKYSPEEIGRITLFLPRVIEGISAIDKLSVAEILIYGDDGSVYLQPAKARSLYQYLERLYGILTDRPIEAESGA